ncbi:MAG TPA: adenylyl-sulfate kinase [Blastocatellia bacterium]|nr:adenylyl-sulfate kinase [Blastocatellia bacterium]
MTIDAADSHADDKTSRSPVVDHRTIAIWELTSPEDLGGLAIAGSMANVAIIVVNACKGIGFADKQHSRIARMLGIKHIIVAVNNMDATGWDAAIYGRIKDAYRDFAANLDFASIECIPVSVLTGDNIDRLTAHSPWYTNASLLGALQNIRGKEGAESAFRLLVDAASESGNQGSHLCHVAAGEPRVGNRVRIIPLGIDSYIESISPAHTRCTPDIHPVVAVTLAGNVVVNRGDVITPYDDPIESSDQFECGMVWMSSRDLMPGRIYTAAINNRKVKATVTTIKYKVDVNSGAHLAAKSLAADDLAVVNMSFDQAVPFEPCATSRHLSGFRLMDPATNDTAAAGTIHFALRRAANIHWQATDVSRQARAALKGQKPRCVWFTGLSGSGKSTIANLLDKRLHSSGRHTFVLDGDNVRHGLNRDLGFTEADRAENIRRIAEVARLMADAGLIVLVSFISPYKAERAFARSLFQNDEFVEVYVDTPLAVCELRDTKGLYAKARAGKLPNFTGLDSPYEPPDSPEFVIKTVECSASEAAERIARLVMQDSTPLPRPDLERKAVIWTRPAVSA